MAAAFQGALRSDSAGTLVQRYQQRVRLDLLENASKAAARPTGWRAILAERITDFVTHAPVLRAVVKSVKVFSANQLVASALLMPFVTVLTGFLIALWPPLGSLEVGLGVLAGIVAVGIVQPFRFVALALTIAVGAGLMVLAVLASPAPAVTDIAVAVAIVLSGLIAHSHGVARGKERAALRQAVKNMEKLEPVDPVAGVLKWTHASLVFDRELARAHRHEQPLSLLRIVIDQWEAVQTHLGPRNANRALAEVGARLIAGSRVVDVVAYHGDAVFDLLLPDTGDLGAVVVARRVAEHVSEYPGVRLRVGVVALGSQAGNIDDLLHCGDIAISIAQQTHRPYAVFGVATMGRQESPERAIKPKALKAGTKETAAS